MLTAVVHEDCDPRGDPLSQFAQDLGASQTKGLLMLKPGWSWKTEMVGHDRQCWLDLESSYKAHLTPKSVMTRPVKEVTKAGIAAFQIQKRNLVCQAFLANLHLPTD